MNVARPRHGNPQANHQIIELIHGIAEPRLPYRYCLNLAGVAQQVNKPLSIWTTGDFRKGLFITRDIFAVHSVAGGVLVVRNEVGAIS